MDLALYAPSAMLDTFRLQMVRCFARICDQSPVLHQFSFLIAEFFFCINLFLVLIP
jgi:hypothetical protein